MTNSKVDYLTMRYMGSKDAEQLIESRLGMGADMYYETGSDKRYEKYNRVLRYGHITVLSEGPKRAGMCVDMTGQGCTEFNLYAEDPDATVKLILNKGKHDAVTRLDIAFDDKDGLLNFDTIIEKIKNGEIRTRVEDVKELKKHSRDGGRTLYIGAEDSDFRVRIYDKAAESQTQNHWIRVEMIIRKKEADRFVRYYLSKINAGAPEKENVQLFYTSAAQFLLKKVAFIEPTQRNISRCPVSMWWTDFLETTTPAKLPTERRVPELEKSAKCQVNRNSPSLVAVTMIYGAEWLIRLLIYGVEWNKLHGERYGILAHDYEAMGFSPAIQLDDETESNLLESLTRAIEVEKKSILARKEGEQDAA